MTDGTDGIAALDYNRPGTEAGEAPSGLQAKKSWFFFENQIVCLGAGITSEAGAAVTTSVNQAIQNGAVKVRRDTISEPAGDRKEYGDLRWVWHDGTGYFFPEPASVTAGAVEQKGSWKNVYDAGSADEVAKKVFSLWINHGTNPKGASYAYVMLPAVSEAELEAYGKNPAATILSNTDQLQAVRCGRVVAAAFYQPGEVDCGQGRVLRVDKPCLVLIRENDGGNKIVVSDPTQKLSRVTLGWQGGNHEVPLPTGPAAGSSVEVNMRAVK